MDSASAWSRRDAMDSDTSDVQSCRRQKQMLGPHPRSCRTVGLGWALASHLSDLSSSNSATGIHMPLAV